ncbi:hypothetical protein [uncultured Prevotella sp.]|uniref:hypothetical protein n=1 Tax=uncultured Prevotella sp. TaxID=159272 RepID=UPI0026068DD2|nr:hypothetical protein [uncultured Prevotella sp.]
MQAESNTKTSLFVFYCRGDACLMQRQCKPRAIQKQACLFFIAEAMPALCKGSASREQYKNKLVCFFIAEAMPALCKVNNKKLQPEILRR